MKVIAESRRATLVEVDGHVRCQCPYACSAAYEPCEFADHPAVKALKVSHNPRRSWWRKLFHIDGYPATGGAS